MKLILVADDYGMTPAISRAIVTLIAAQRLSATSCMTTMPAFRAAVPALAALRDRAGIGLHLNLTVGAPSGPMPRLAPDGRFPRFGMLARRSLSGRLDEAEVAAEIDRQLARFEEAFGGPPDFVDGHQHVHVLPVIRQALLAHLARRGLAGRVWLRDPADRIGAILARGVSIPKALVISALAGGFGRAAHAAGFRTNQGFSGVSAFDPSRNFGADMARFVTAPGPAHLVMVHPGEAPDPDLAALDPVIATRPIELAFLMSDDFGALISKLDVTLAPGL